MSEWQPIETAKGQSPQSDDYVSVLLSDGKMIGIGWVMVRGSGVNKGMVSGYLGTAWTHWMPLPTPPKQ